MHTPWGEVAVSDAHLHFFSYNFFRMLGAQKGGLTAEDVVGAIAWELPDADPAEFASRWVQELSRHGLHSAVMIASLPGDEDSVAAAVARYPERLHGYFIVNPLEPDAVERVDRALARGLLGVCLFPAMHRYSLHDERVVGVVERVAAQPRAVLFVHCGVLSVGVRGKLGLPSPFDLRYSNPIDVHGVALRFPSLPFVLPHFGAGYLREALMVASLCPNVYLDTSSSNSWMVLQPEPMTLEQVFDRALAVIGPKRLLFGTDSSFFPRGWNRAIFDQQVSALQDVGVTDAEAVAILGGNLRRLLGVH